MQTVCITNEHRHPVRRPSILLISSVTAIWSSIQTFTIKTVNPGRAHIIQLYLPRSTWHKCHGLTLPKWRSRDRVGVVTRLHTLSHAQICLPQQERGHRWRIWRAPMEASGGVQLRKYQSRVDPNEKKLPQPRRILHRNRTNHPNRRNPAPHRQKNIGEVYFGECCLN